MSQKGPVVIVLIIAAVVGGYLVYTNYSNNRSATRPQSPNPDYETTSQMKGVLKGTVKFIGKPCAPGSKNNVPPCNGLYPNYEIIVYATDGKTIVSRVTSDENGNYKIEVDPGNYIIYTARSISKDDRRENKFTIIKDQTTNLDLIIDTGIR